MSLSEVFRDALALERGMLVEVPLPAGGKVKQIANPIKFSETSPEYHHAGVTAGTHTREVLTGLGYRDEEITKFEKTGLFM